MWWGEIAQGQYGLVTWDQGVALGGRGRMERAIEHGLLVRELPATYVVTGAPWSKRRDLMAACLASGGHVSMRTAAWFEGFPVVSLRTEITTTSARRVRLPGVKAHRSTYLPPHHVTRIDGIPITTPARTAVDISACFGDDTLTTILSEAERRKLFTFAEVATVLTDVRRRGRRRVAHLAPILDYLMGADRGDSEGEDWAARTLRAAGLGGFERNVWLVANGQRFCVDILFMPHKVVVEYDGYDAHGRLRTAFDGDRDRIAELELAGYLVIPVTSKTTRTVLVDRVQRALEQRRPTSGH
jgi:very-short-patch-repair endonuclease